MMRSAAVLLFASALVALPAGARAQAEREPVVLAADAEVGAVLDGARALFEQSLATHDEGPANRARWILGHIEPDEAQRIEHMVLSAMVYARGPDSRMRVGDHPNDWFVDPNSIASMRSLRLLRDVLHERPDHRAAALELARWALDRQQPLVAAEAEIALVGIEQDADVLLARAELNLLLGDFQLAASLADDARRAGADGSLARHVRAYALLQEPATEDAGVAAYYDGARALTDAGRAAYERALGPIIDADALEAWRALDDVDAPRFLERHWNRSAASSGVTPAERLAEHYRRLHRARTQYPPDAPMSSAEIFSRYATGKDNRIFAVSLEGTMLVRHDNPYLLQGLIRCLTNAFNHPGDCATIEDRRGAARLAKTESFNPFVREILFGGGVYAFRGARGGTELVFAVTLPVRSANALVDGTGSMAGLLSAILLPDTGDVVRRDTAFRAPLPRRLDPMAAETDALALLHTTIDVPAPEPSYAYRITLSDPFRHAGRVVAGRVDVPRLDGFALSDLAVAPADLDGTYARGDVRFALAPFRIYRPGERFRLYYEIYGLEEGAQYRTDVRLRPHRPSMVGRLRGMLDRPIQLRFDGVAPAPHPQLGAQELRTVDLDGVEPGVWQLTVTVTDLATGRAVERTTLIDVGAADSAP